MEIEWADPPAHALGRQGGGHYAEFAAALRDPANEDPESPGCSRWAKLPSTGKPRTEKGAAGTAQNLRLGRMKDFKPKDAWEAVPDGITVYVRYVGEPTPGPSSKDSGKQGGDDDAEPGPEGATASAPSAPPPPSHNPALVRRWARENGFNVTDRGRMPQEVHDAYDAAQRRSHVRAVPHG